LPRPGDEPADGTFALLASILLAAVAFLVFRAVESVDVERRVRHETLAERVFDEMERALTRFVAGEEERPFAPYRGGGAADAPPVLGWFELDATGRVRVPAASSTAATREIETAVAAALRDERPLEVAAASQAPGSTIPLDGKGARIAQKRMARDDTSVDQALRSLNKGVEQRAQRQMKVAQVPDDLGRVELSPLAGRRIDGGRLVLVRTATAGSQKTRQGLVLDVGVLGRWLAAQSLGATELGSRATLDFGDDSVSRAAGDLVYRHRFAEPFETLNARLALAPLAGVGGGRYVIALSALSLLAVVLGLAALYRLTAVVLRDAERRSSFVAAVTHELKTPLTAIRMYGEMLRDGIVPTEAKRDEYYRHITSESERLTRLVNNVLELARLEKGARAMSLEPGDVGAVVGEVATLVRPHVEGAGFALEVDAQADLPRVRFERDALMQVLFNLVDNAVKYSDGSASRRIELRCAACDGGVRVTVRDHGPGVPARHLGRIFEPFYRGENELTRRTKGTGIGLALVRGLVERMGARVQGRNPPDGGFEVAIELTKPS
jgi:signal transduction histidine kinase